MIKFKIRLVLILMGSFSLVILSYPYQTKAAHRSVDQVLDQLVKDNFIVGQENFFVPVLYWVGFSSIIAASTSERL